METKYMIGTCNGLGEDPNAAHIVGSDFYLISSLWTVCRYHTVSWEDTPWEPAGNRNEQMEDSQGAGRIRCRGQKAGRVDTGESVRKLLERLVRMT